MITIEIYKDRNGNYYVQAGDYKVRIADGTRHDGTTIGHFELVNKLTIPAVVEQSEQLICPCCGSDNTYQTDAIHCNRCAVTTEI